MTWADQFSAALNGRGSSGKGQTFRKKQDTRIPPKVCMAQEKGGEKQCFRMEGRSYLTPGAKGIVTQVGVQQARQDARLINEFKCLDKQLEANRY